jgi:uncharacterized RDD family membrane protein YckC
MWRRGQTLAMKTWRIQIVDVAGQRINRITALKRYVASWLWFIPPLAVSSALGLHPVELTFLSLGWITVWCVLSRFHPEGQFWHDAFAGTRLITVAT